MSLERLHCPSCGAPLASGGAGPFFCSYCGSRLRTGQDSDPATPEALLASKRSASRQLEAELARLRAQEKHMQERLLSAAGRRRMDAPSGWLLAAGYGALGIGILLLLGGVPLGFVFVLPGLALLVYYGVFTQAAEEDHQEATAGLPAELNVVRLKIRDAREELDRLHREMDRLRGGA